MAAPVGGRADEISGKCVLVVEDDYVLAREVCNDLKSHGAHVLGPAPTVHYANLIIGRRPIDGAILDIHLHGQDVYPLVEDLTARGVPIIFATAYQPEQIDARYRGFDVVSKPLDLARLRRKVAAFRPLPISPRASSEPVTNPPQAGPHPGNTVLRSTAGMIADTDRWARFLLQAMRQSI